MDASALHRITLPQRAAHALRTLVALLACGIAQAPAAAQSGDIDPALPARLSDTGLYRASSSTQVRADVLAFTPQYPLWSDGADKRRWIRLPAGSAIDASMPDAWQFPPGTQLWKEFSHAGRRVETRYIERTRSGAWRYATYVWNDAGTDAELAPARGIAALPVSEAPQGRYAVPGRSDCTACHEGSATPVLGFGALQLSPDRDPLAVHAQPARRDDVDLPTLMARGLLRPFDATLLQRVPRIAAASPTERAALGYLHGNCGHCHNRSGAGVPLQLTLAQSARDAAASRTATLSSTLGIAGRYRGAALPPDSSLIAPHAPERSVLLARMRSRAPHLQMPPLGTELTDREGSALVERWIDQLSPVEEPSK